MTLDPVERIVRERLGLDAGSLGATLFPRVVAKRMKTKAIHNAAAYAGLLTIDASEWAELVSELVVSETWFFRGGQALFDYLAMWVQGRTTRPVRILSVPCSTGEEPYSLAIALRERNVQPGGIEIDGVDVAAAHLVRAEAGRYTQLSFRDCPADLRSHYFVHRANEHWELKSEIRKAVRLQHGNVVDPSFMSGAKPYDLILCRNLFIYLTAESRERASANLIRSLKGDGLLCVSPAEADRLPAHEFVPTGRDGYGLFRRGTRGEERAAKLKPGADIPVRPSQGEPAPTTPSISRELSKSVPPSIAAEPITVVKTNHPDQLAEARSLADAGRLTEALIACEKLLVGAVATADGFSLLGVLHLASGRADDAASAFRKALYLDPDHAEALSQMIVLSERRGETAQAAGFRRRLSQIKESL